MSEPLIGAARRVSRAIERADGSVFHAIRFADEVAADARGAAIDFARIEGFAARPRVADHIAARAEGAAAIVRAIGRIFAVGIADLIAAEASLLAIEVARGGVFAAIGLTNTVAADATIDGAVLGILAAVLSGLADTVTADARSAAIIRARIGIFAATALAEPIAASATIDGAVLSVLAAERIANTVAARANDGAIAVAIALGFIALRLTDAVAARAGLSAITGT